MNDLKDLVKEIMPFITDIESNYAEIYRSLYENPMTLPLTNNPHIDKKVIQEYLESLMQLLRHHLETHKNK